MNILKRLERIGYTVEYQEGYTGPMYKVTEGANTMFFDGVFLDQVNDFLDLPLIDMPIYLDRDVVWKTRVSRQRLLKGV